MEVTFCQPDYYCKLTSLPRAEFDHMFQPVDDPAGLPHLDKTKEVINEYLKIFLPPRNYCIECKSQQPGIFGNFRWGIQNGEGECSVCGWPARAIHRLVSPNALTGEEERATVNFIMQYHPEHVRIENLKTRRPL